MPRPGRDALLRRIGRRSRLAKTLVRGKRLIARSRRSLAVDLYEATFRSDAEALAYHYATHNDHLPDLENPVWINEKIRWQFLHHPNPLMSLAADKIAVRDYLRFKGASILAPEIYASGTDPQELATIDLPDRFALKSTYGSGQNHIEHGGTPTPRGEHVRRVAGWAENDYWCRSSELHYREIPKRWLIEEYVPAERERLEFKFFCIMGEPAFISVITERTAHGFKRANYYPDWTRAPFGGRGVGTDPNPVARPDDLDLMLAEARLLSEDFLHVRVDFLKFDGRLVFSELTFANLAARIPFEPVDVNVSLGNLMDLAQAPALLARGERIAAALTTPASTSPAAPPDRPVARPSSAAPVTAAPP